jgi:TRAP-type C4-dicarboxylate transport system permease small subunit
MNAAPDVTATGAPRWLRGLESVVRPLENVAALVGASMMLLAMAFMTLDATLRYLFNSPIQFASRLIEFYLMVGMFAMPLAWGFRTGGYIRIVGAVALLPERIQHLVLRLGLFVSALYVAMLAWTSGRHFLDAWERDEVYVGVWDWSVAWSWIWVPAGLTLLTLRLLILTVGPASELNAAHSDAPGDKP